MYFFTVCDLIHSVHKFVFFLTVYSLVQFVDDGILAICTPKNIRTTEDGRTEAQYGDGYYLCTVIFKSGESFHCI